MNMRSACQGGAQQVSATCLSCPHVFVVADPDPYAWFCSDDVAVLCGLTPNADGSKPFASSRPPFPFRPVCVSCRPHRTDDDEATRPDWCPLDAKPPTGEG